MLKICTILVLILSNVLAEDKDALTDKKDALAFKKDDLADKDDALTNKKRALNFQTDDLADTKDTLADKDDNLANKNDDLAGSDELPSDSNSEEKVEEGNEDHDLEKPDQGGNSTNSQGEGDYNLEEEDMEGVEEEDDDEDNLYGAVSDHNEDEEVRGMQQIIQKPLSIIIRCSRRFTPGVCAQPVVSVWTYVFDQQNCTERLGCRFAIRTNRFKSYNRCNRMCMSMTNVYSKVLDLEKVHKDHSKRTHGLPLLRAGIRWDQANKDAPNLPRLSETSSDNEGRPVAREYYDYIERGKQTSYDYGSTNGDDEGLVSPDLDEFGVGQDLLDDFRRF